MKPRFSLCCKQISAIAKPPRMWHRKALDEKVLSHDGIEQAAV
jgi:hypothetical protein